MSILSYQDISYARAAGDIVITPFDPDALGTNSYDVHLARTLLIYDEHTPDGWRAPVMDVKKERATKEIIIDDPTGFILRPGELYLGCTVEYTETHKHIPFLEGKSSLGRFGLSIHVTAGKGDVSFCGYWTMEISVIKPLRIYAGMPIGQLIYHEVSSQPVIDYAAKASQKYAAQHTQSDDPKPVASRMWKNFPDGKSL